MGKVGGSSPGCQYDPSRISVGSVLASPAWMVVSTPFQPDRYEVEGVEQNFNYEFSHVNLIVEEGALARHSKGVGHNGIRHALTLGDHSPNMESRANADEKDRPGTGSTPAARLVEDLEMDNGSVSRYGSWS